MHLLENEPDEEVSTYLDKIAEMPGVTTEREQPLDGEGKMKTKRHQQPRLIVKVGSY